VQAAADTQTAAAVEGSSVAQQQQQQLEAQDWVRLQEQQRAKRDVGGAQPPAGRLSVKERLSLRRQEVLQKQQQQQAAREAGASAAGAVRGAAGGARTDQGLGPAAAFLPSSDHPLAVAVQNSSRLLAAKIQVG
jgi:hypothetical protein